MASLAPHQTDPLSAPARVRMDGDGLLLGAVVALALAVAVLLLGFLVLYATLV